jgi:hypothetical protein
MDEVALLCRFCNHISLVWVMKTDGRPVYNFVEVLPWTRIHKSTPVRTTATTSMLCCLI